MDTTFSHIKAVFCDIDGTLLTSQHTVSPRTVAAIRALRERGVLFGPVSYTHLDVYKRQGQRPRWS